MIKTSRILSLILTLIIASASWTGAKAQQYVEAKAGTQAHVGDFYYLLDQVTRTAILTDKTYTGSTTGSNSYSGAVIVPETFQAKDNNDETVTFTVIGIDDCAFYGCTELISVEIPKSVTEIGSQVFDHSTKLQEIAVNPQNQYYYAKDGVLYNKLQTELIFCTRLKEGQFTVPSDVKKIHSYAFNGCKSITKVVLPNGLKTIGDFAFMNCTGMTSVNIPTGLTTLGTNAFRGASSLASSITIPAALTIISSSAFQGCKKISNVTIPEGITTIGEYAFSECSSLQSIELPTTLNELGISSFYKAGLTSINIPNNITDIPASAFAGCKLTSITLPEGLRTIKTEAFYNNGTTINSVSIPQSVTNISNNAFSGTSVQNFYINNTPNRLSIGEYTPFKKSGTAIHVFTKMKSIFENATNWSKYAGYFVEDIEITHVESLTLDNTRMTVLTNKPGKLNVTINPEDARVKDVIFTSSNENVILIANAATGDFVAGANVGDAIITCTALDGSGAYATCKVFVKNSFTPAESVTINKTSANMEVDATLTLSASVAPSEADYRNIIWVSSDKSIATVDDHGVVTAKAPGEAIITAISGDGAARAYCIITVNYGELTLEDGTSYQNDAVLPVKTLTYSRNFTNTSWQPLYIPFRMSYDDWADKFDVARLLNMHSYDTNNDGEIDEMKLEIAYVKGGTLKENHPYFIKAKSVNGDSETKTITINNATIYPAENNTLQCASTEYTYDFNGVYETTTGLKSIGGYIMQGGAFKSPGNDATKVKAYRFYMQVKEKGGQFVTNINEAKIVVVDEFGFEETTSINSVESDQNNVTAVYNVNGIKQTSTKQGLNIIKMADGTTKKIFVK